MMKANDPTPLIPHPHGPRGCEEGKSKAFWGREPGTFGARLAPDPQGAKTKVEWANHPTPLDPLPAAQRATGRG